MAKKKGFFLTRWLKRGVMGSDQEVKDIMQEEQVQTPFRTMLRNFLSKTTVRVGLVGFFLVFLFVLIGPRYWVLDLSEQDSTLINLPPSQNMMSVPSEMKGKIADIAAGRTYGVGLDTDGKLHTWGYTRITEKINVADIPKEVQEADIVMFAAGDDHVVALDKNGQLYVWGNTRLQQGNFTSDMKKKMKDPDESWDIIQLEASNQFSAAVSSDGTLYLWGNSNLADIKLRSQYQGQVAKVALTSNEYICLLKDGTVAYTGFKDKGSAFAAIPEALKATKVVDIASTSSTMAAVTEDGRVVVWGNDKNGEKSVPEFSAPVKKLYGGRFHYTALLENGDVVCWGSNKYGQCDVPAAVAHGAKIREIYTGNFQNYAVMEDGSVQTWGLKGFILGTDNLGRDLLTRIVNGGRVTMTVGAISVIIATFIGVVLGGLAGYFGGKTDLLIMRIAEVVGGLPFIPFAMILSAVIGSRLDPTQKMYLVMVVLGVLSWTGTCRLIRAQILAQREMEYVTAAKAMGIKEGVIVFRHILPNVLSLLLVSMTLDFATCMLTESGLSYLGFGIPLPTPTWGNLLKGANNSVVIQQYWWQWVFPASIFGVCTICINMIGDGLRDAVDPKSAER
ncbi:MAG: ABC transporter permease subunit [Clostridia bacterium]|nr:ABC transporter permease subunit [Clostridia bacterium]MBQ6961971.1 ABC transporter permease subunit [Clostridia bacterium]